MLDLQNIRVILTTIHTLKKQSIERIMNWSMYYINLCFFLDGIMEQSVGQMQKTCYVYVKSVATL